MKNLAFLSIVLVSVLTSVNAQELNKEAFYLSQNNARAYQGIVEIVQHEHGSVSTSEINTQAEAREAVLNFKYIKNSELLFVITLHSLQPQRYDSKQQAMQATANWVNIHKDLKSLELERKIAKMSKKDKLSYSGKTANSTADILTGAGFGAVVVGAVVLAPPVVVVGGLCMTTGFIISRVAAHKTSSAIMDIME